VSVCLDVSGRSGGDRSSAVRYFHPCPVDRSESLVASTVCENRRAFAPNEECGPYRAAPGRFSNGAEDCIVVTTNSRCLNSGLSLRHLTTSIPKMPLAIFFSGPLHDLPSLSGVAPLYRKQAWRLVRLSSACGLKSQGILDPLARIPPNRWGKGHFSEAAAMARSSPRTCRRRSAMIDARHRHAGIFLTEHEYLWPL
jgi:hypothetical protein